MYVAKGQKMKLLSSHELNVLVPIFFSKYTIHIFSERSGLRITLHYL